MDYKKLKALLDEHKPEVALATCREELQKLPITDFHKALEINWLTLRDGVAEYINQFYKQAKRKIKDVQTIYCEMNAFTINHNGWFVQFFAFKKFLGREDFDWLSDYNYCDFENALLFTKLEEIQAVFKNYMDNKLWKDIIQKEAFGLAENIVLFSVQELFKLACSVGKTKQYEWADIPLFITVHDSDLLFEATFQ